MLLCNSCHLLGGHDIMGAAFLLFRCQGCCNQVDIKPEKAKRLSWGEQLNAVVYAY